MSERAFAVVPKAMPRERAISPRSADWTLYDPKRLADILGLPISAVDAALEKTGFNKAVRIREEVIRWKERLRCEERELQARLDEINKERHSIGIRLTAVREDLANLRNVLRLPRENPSFTQDTPA